MKSDLYESNAMGWLAFAAAFLSVTVAGLLAGYFWGPIWF